MGPALILCPFSSDELTFVVFGYSNIVLGLKLIRVLNVVKTSIIIFNHNFCIVFGKMVAFDFAYATISNENARFFVIFYLISINIDIVISNEQYAIPLIIFNLIVFDALYSGETNNAVEVLSNLIVFYCIFFPVYCENTLSSGFSDHIPKDEAVDVVRSL